MKTVILGGGLSGVTLAYFLNRETTILEKEVQIGGLCRSFDFNGIYHDIGPHILFSKDKKQLEACLSVIDSNKIKRSNKIYHKGKLVKYPFENDLASLDKDERDYCLKEFLNNPYENYEAKNMLQFFLKTFGEGITRLYLAPHNAKIWKFDPSYMDTQVVERIPKPPREDVIKSARGIQTEGYLHQLYFHYPKTGGIQELVNGFAKGIVKKSKVMTAVNIKQIRRKDKTWEIETDKGKFSAGRLLNCMPLHELFEYLQAPEEILRALGELKYNSIYIVCLQAKKDKIGRNFAINFADKNIIFHRLSKINFLGEKYSLDKGGATIMAEITYRPNSYLAGLKEDKIKDKVITALDELKLVDKNEITDVDLKKFQYAYVIYDLNHRKNADRVLNYLLGEGIDCCGRFAEFEYLNMDKIIDHSFKLAGKLNGVGKG